MDIMVKETTDDIWIRIQPDDCIGLSFGALSDKTTENGMTSGVAYVVELNLNHETAKELMQYLQAMLEE